MIINYLNLNSTENDMAFQIIRKDFLPIASYDGSQYREFAVKYSYTR